MRIKNKNIVDYCIGINSIFIFNKNYGLVPNLITLSYAFAFVRISKVKEIYFADFERFKSEDLRIQEIEDTIKKSLPSFKLIYATPRKYNDLAYKSIYGCNF